METQQLWISTRNDERTELFRMLFQLSLELENYCQNDSDLGHRVNNIIEAIDQCMDLLLQEAIKKKF
ncbi:MAG: hypothetical protein AB8B56_15260 [Crocinitomicaceae bacterium]